MGLLDDLWKDVRDTAKYVGKIAAKIEKIARRAGLEDIARWASWISKSADVLRIAPGPILEGGQLAIKAMLSLTGEDTETGPERGKSFVISTEGYKSVTPTLDKAKKQHAWEGSAAHNYHTQVDNQISNVATMIDAEGSMHPILDREANQILDTRQHLRREHNWLADVGQVTMVLSAIPGYGKAMQAAVEFEAVSVSLADCSHKMWQMHNEANANAADVRKVIEDYKTVAQRSPVDDSFEGFDPPPPPRRPQGFSTPTRPAEGSQPGVPSNSGTPASAQSSPAAAVGTPASAVGTPASAAASPPPLFGVPTSTGAASGPAANLPGESGRESSPGDVTHAGSMPTPSSPAFAVTPDRAPGGAIPASSGGISSFAGSGSSGGGGQPGAGSSPQGQPISQRVQWSGSQPSSLGRSPDPRLESTGAASGATGDRPPIDKKTSTDAAQSAANAAVETHGPRQ